MDVALEPSCSLVTILLVILGDYLTGAGKETATNIGTVIVRHIPVAQKLKLSFGDCADARNKMAENFFKQNSLFKFISQFWHILYHAVADSTQKIY